MRKCHVAWLTWSKPLNKELRMEKGINRGKIHLLEAWLEVVGVPLQA
jgi:hypothetical protein